ncbi:MAG: hypothetical protein Q8R53_04610, partial [Nanoarchaeota archaeon]|nr:hypothetical protein [Nanoarchaeota archaeon]
NSGSAVNNVKAGKQFARTARAVLARDMSAADSRNWFTLDDMLEVAEAFGICGVFHSDRSHWRLVLGVNVHETLKVYDPLYKKEGSHVYYYKPPTDAVSMPSRDLQRIFRIDGSELFRSESHRLDLLRKKGYALNLPANFRNERLQGDGHNCGPLVLYAAMVGNKYTPQFGGKADFVKLKQLSGIDIV